MKIKDAYIRDVRCKETSYGQVASDEEKVRPQTVGVEGMRPVSGRDVKDGTYEVEAESSSSMFRIERAVLTVSEGRMSAEITLSGKGYEKLFLGTGAEAAAGDASDYVGYVENQEGKYVYTIPVDALDAPIACAAFSINKKKWYDRDILFRAGSLPEEAVLAELPDYEALEKEAKQKRIEAMKEEKTKEERTKNSSWAEPASVEAEDGEYWIDVDLQGEAAGHLWFPPSALAVREGRAYGRIVWDSSSYDYMKVGEETYFPINDEGNSVFEFPVAVFDQVIPVIADTTAMSVPHEIEYSLIFHYDSLRPAVRGEIGAGKVVAGGLTAAVLCAALFIGLRKKHCGKGTK